MAEPNTGVTSVGVLAKTEAPVPVSSESEVNSWREVIESVAVPYRVPEVGRVTFVAPVVKSERALVAENVMTSPPARVIEFVAKVVESETVRVLPAVIFKVLVPLLVMVKPLIVVAVAAPKTGAMNVLLLKVCDFVLNVNSSTTPAKSGMVKVVAPIV